MTAAKKVLKPIAEIIFKEGEHEYNMNIFAKTKITFKFDKEEYYATIEEWKELLRKYYE